MKVLHIYKTYYPDTTGGVEQVIHQLCNTLPQHNIQSDVAVCSETLTSDFQSHYQIFRYRTTFSMASCPISWSFLKDFKKRCKPYDLIHYHFPWPFADIMQMISNP